MRIAPTVTSIFFVAITFSRVAHFVDSQMSSGDVVSLAFAAGLGVAVFVSAYHTRSYKTRSNAAAAQLSRLRKQAWVILFLMVLFDGMFNLADVLATADPNTSIVFVVAFGIFPTLTAMMFGLLQGAVDAAPAPMATAKKRSWPWMRTGTANRKSGTKTGTKSGITGGTKNGGNGTKAGTKSGTTGGGPVFHVRSRRELNAEMREYLRSDRKAAELNRMFPDVKPRAIRRWRQTEKAK